MGFTWRKELLSILLIAAMFVASVLLWPSAPEQVPVYYNLADEPDAYGSKAVGLFSLPGLVLLVYVSMLSRTYTNQERANRGRFPVSFAVLRGATVVFLAAIHAYALTWIAGA